MDGIDLNLTDYMKFVFAFIFVLALIALAAVAARYFGFGLPSNPRNSAHRRLGIIESLNVDGKRRMVLVRRDDIEHLLLLGATTELVIESSITPSRATYTKSVEDTGDVTKNEVAIESNTYKPQHSTPVRESTLQSGKSARKERKK